MIDPAIQFSSSANTHDYRNVFLGRVHEVLQLGYRRLDAKSYCAHDEPSITGNLVESIRAVMNDPKSPRWMNFFHVEDDPPVNNGTQTGKRRDRVDIELSSAVRRPRCRFSFEAKRLGVKNPVSDYVGCNGLGCFLDGKYAAKSDDAGMIGYVQSDSPDKWADKLAAQLNGSVTGHAVCSDGQWKVNKFKNGPGHTFHTRHKRKTIDREINIYHSLLIFC